MSVTRRWSGGYPSIGGSNRLQRLASPAVGSGGIDHRFTVFGQQAAIAGCGSAAYGRSVDKNLAGVTSSHFVESRGAVPAKSGTSHAMALLCELAAVWVVVELCSGGNRADESKGVVGKTHGLRPPGHWNSARLQSLELGEAEQYLAITIRGGLLLCYRKGRPACFPLRQ